jgi:hypothetical protein
MDTDDLLAHLRECGVVVRHAATMPPPAEGWKSSVLFLEGTAEECEVARRCALDLPGIIKVRFSGHTPTIMYVSERCVPERH